MTFAKMTNSRNDKDQLHKKSKIIRMKSYKFFNFTAGDSFKGMYCTRIRDRKEIYEKEEKDKVSIIYRYLCP